MIIGNAVTEGLAGANLWDFMTGRSNGKYVAGADGSARLTLPGMIKGETYHPNSTVQSIPDAIKYNFNKHWGMVVGTLLVAPVAAKTLKKVLRKPVLTPMNKVIKMTGLDVKV